MDYLTFKSKVETFKLNEGITCLAFNEEASVTNTSTCNCCERTVNEEKVPCQKYNPSTASLSTTYTLCEHCIFYFKYNLLDPDRITAIDS